LAPWSGSLDPGRDTKLPIVAISRRCKDRPASTILTGKLAVNLDTVSSP
jgi:hypothetical protein